MHVGYGTRRMSLRVTNGIAIEALSASLRPPPTDLAAAPKMPALCQRTEVAHAAQSATSGTNRCARQRRVAGTATDPVAVPLQLVKNGPSHGALNWDAGPPSGPVMLASQNCSRGGCVAQVSISHRSG
jgi:hypothetical protein